MKTGPLGAGVPYGDPSLNTMRVASSENLLVKERYQYYLLREREELYDWSADPGSWHNLASDTEYSDVLLSAREGLIQWMKSMDDPFADDYHEFLQSLKASD